MFKIAELLELFDPIKPFLQPSNVSIENFFFKLHYRFTFLILLAATFLASSGQYFGEPIQCISDTIPEKVINSFCFITTTFTVVRHLNNSALDIGAIFQPGIGPHHFIDEPIKRHAYYQWIPFILFGQALCFLVPHIMWTRWEDNRVKGLVNGFKMASISRYIHSKLNFGNLEIPSKEETEIRVKDIRYQILYRMRLNKLWGIQLMIAEWMNLFNIVLQIWWTNKFLGGQFYSLGNKVLLENWQNKMDILDVVFPKVTKCNFRKFGPSGSLQVHDALCVMALNIINEKIYAVLWFWFLFVLATSIVAVLWRFATMIFFQYEWFSFVVFSLAKSHRRANRPDLFKVIKKCNFSNWMYLSFLASNLSDSVFRRIIENLAEEFSETPRDGTPPHIEVQRIESPTDKSPQSIDTVDAPLL